MLDNSKARQQHSEAVEKFFDEYLQQKHTVADFKLMHAVYSNKELYNVNIDNINVLDSNHGKMRNNNLDFQLNKNSKELNNSPSKINVHTADLSHITEEQKACSPKSSISISRLILQADSNSIQYFDEINNRDPI